MSEASSTATVPSPADQVAVAAASGVVLSALDRTGHRLRRPRPSPPGDTILSN